MIEILLGALAEAVFSRLVEDLAQHPGLAELREKLRGASPEILAFQRALTATYISFSHEYPSLASSLFDEYYLRNTETVDELVKLLTPNQIPNKSKLTEIWRNQFHNIPSIDLGLPLSYFLDTLEQEIKAQPLLKPFFDSRALEQLYVIALRSQDQIDVQKQMRNLLADIHSLLERRSSESYSLSEMNKTNNRSTTQSNKIDLLIDFLLTVPAFHNRSNRDALLFGLEHLSGSIPRYKTPVTDIIAIVQSLEAMGKMETGEWPLIILIRNARRYCPANTDLGRQFEEIAVQISNHYGA